MDAPKIQAMAYARLCYHQNERPQGEKTPPKRLNSSKLKDPSISEKLISDLNKKLANLKFGSASVEEEWGVFRNLVYTSSPEHLGPASKKHQDKKSAFTKCHRQVQIKLRTMQDKWLSDKADEIQGYAEQHDSKCFYDTFKAIYGPTTSGTSPILAADGETLFPEKSQILERRAEHFDNILNRPSSINDAAINRLSHVDMNSKLDDPPTEEEAIKANKQLSCGKAPGADAIPEVHKDGGQVLMQKLTDLYAALWNKQELPQEFKDATIVHLYKRKGNRLSCDNHRGISLLSIVGKILARALLNRIIKHLESQCGFRAGRGTVDTSAVRQLSENSQEQHQDLYMTFVDLTMAFDTVSRAGLWKIMAKFGCPPDSPTCYASFMMARVLDDSEMSKDFPVRNGVNKAVFLRLHSSP
ncbi:uncharacterized protein LOC125025249 [Penaeus chinensis]|uniref:uncharacterized protein LOC125025249 n=1 Tax=Penaeus chinensis TaxID=139456 RepID=UPI001FB611E6|nr:uncharacterized protein LOC125025249 [Penaeus chinensis]